MKIRACEARMCTPKAVKRQPRGLGVRRVFVGPPGVELVERDLSIPTQVQLLEGGVQLRHGEDFTELRTHQRELGLVDEARTIRVKGRERCTRSGHGFFFGWVVIRSIEACKTGKVTYLLSLLLSRPSNPRVA